ncbi:MAG: GxxExxY protein [Parcubacteria group bacterium CG_4_10_14_0_8_um_filter_35_7]|nr:MAG: GxxExxY protein [Parcubacteria group bacterium CG23_combo_of_CG06-09_8_20_14_all_35_9]PIY78490.1 MAG: GxxExxY protein [Parcubacteria group bacterium CG_4_10_14_0_8_um_filter_35_7]
MKKKIDLIYPHLSYKLSGLLFEVHNELGRFCKERQYVDLMEIKLKESRWIYEREKELPINYNNKSIKGNRVDFSIENKILLEAKAKKFITKEDYFQMRRYLKASGFKLGFIVNFRNTYLKPKRIINIY